MLNIDNETEWEGLVSDLLVDEGGQGERSSSALSDLQNSWGGRMVEGQQHQRHVSVPRETLNAVLGEEGEAGFSQGHHAGHRSYYSDQQNPFHQGVSIRPPQTFLGQPHRQGSSAEDVAFAAFSQGPEVEAYRGIQAQRGSSRSPQSMPPQNMPTQNMPTQFGGQMDYMNRQVNSDMLLHTQNVGGGGSIDLEDLDTTMDSLGGVQSHALGSNFTLQSDHEYTSRTLFVRNISSNTEDPELIDLFGAYGDIRDMYSACKYRGFVMISFFDERSAMAAMECLQGKSLRRRKMDIHFSIPKENQTDCGMLILFNVEQSMPNTVIANLFQAFGEIKSMKSLHIQQTYQSARTTVRMIEYYDERHAAAALKSLNNTELWNRRIKIQFGRVGRVLNMQRMQRMQPNPQNQHSPSAGQSISAAAVDCDAGDHHVHQVRPEARYSANVMGVQGNMDAPPHGVGSSRGFVYNQSPPGQQQGRFPYDNRSREQHRMSKRGGGESFKSKKKSHFSLNLQNIAEGKDTKTTVMIRNIPNKYTQKMLLAEVDTELQGKYNFFYLPIDFKNQCNVGYAFINLTDPLWILKLNEKFNGKRWSHFNSGKICEITYARIQGKEALVAHFRHSTLMQVDESCQPLLLNENQEVEEIFAFAGSPNQSRKGAPQNRQHRQGGHQGQNQRMQQGMNKQNPGGVDSKSDSGSPPPLEVAN